MKQSEEPITLTMD